MRGRQTVAAWSILLVLTGCRTGPGGGPPAATELPPHPCVLPLLLVGGLPTVAVRIGGHTGTFLVDTGTDRLLFDPARIAGERPLRPADGSLHTAAGIPAHLQGETRLNEVRLGEAVFRGVPAGAIDLSGLAAALGAPIDGILGCDLFADCVLVIDGPRRELRLLASRPADLPPPVATGIFRDTVPWLDCFVAGRDVRCLVDTCFQRGVALPPALEPLPWRRAPQTDGELVTLGGTTGRRRGRLRGAFTCGQIHLVDPWVTLAPGSAKIGAEVLRDLVLVLDRRGSGFALHRR